MRSLHRDEGAIKSLADEDARLLDINDFDERVDVVIPFTHVRKHCHRPLSTRRKRGIGDKLFFGRSNEAEEQSTGGVAQ